MTRLRRGFTLFEIMIVAALLTITGTIVVAVLIPSLRSTAAIQRRTSMQQKALLVFRRISNDLQDTTPAALSISTAPPVLAGQPAKDFTPEASLQYESRLWAYCKVGDKLKRVTWKSPGPPSLPITLQAETPLRLGQPVLASMTALTFQESLTLTDGVSSFTLAHAGVGPAVAGPISIELFLKDAGTDPAQVKMRRVFSPRLGE